MSHSHQPAWLPAKEELPVGVARVLVLGCSVCGEPWDESCGFPDIDDTEFFGDD